MAQRDERGLFVPGYRVAPDCGEDFSDLEIRSCPVAGANRMAPIINAYNRHRSGLFNLSLSYPSPSCAVHHVQWSKLLIYCTIIESQRSIEHKSAL
jgi:hypothetical protein